MRGATSWRRKTIPPSTYFNPRAPRGARLSASSGAESVITFQSTRPMRGATRRRLLRQKRRSISIHAPHAGRDGLRASHQYHEGHFNPRAPCGARRSSTLCTISFASTFQSTRPMRGATDTRRLAPFPSPISIHAPHAGRDHDATDAVAVYRDFNPRAPCGARQRLQEQYSILTRISIHAPHAGRDGREQGYHPQAARFQSTRPMRGATQRDKRLQERIDISIHAPHAGRDLELLELLQHLNISIHAPHAGRDPSPYRLPCKSRISIHAPHAGRDPPSALCSPQCRHFNPRAPCGARLDFEESSSESYTFQSTRPMRGATCSKVSGRGSCLYFNPRAPCGARPP